jgi:hypothetical protein
MHCTTRPMLRAVAAAAFAACALPGQAVTLNTAFGGGNYADTALGGTTVAERPELAGVVLEDVLQPFSFNGATGTVQNRVVRETASGTLDFYWRVMVDAQSTGHIEAFRVGDFGYSYLTDADWRIDGLGSAAPYVGRLFNPASNPGGDINFLFTDPAVGGPGYESSRFFFVHTGATAYAKTAQYDMLCAPNGCISQTYQTFAPAVPEPQTYALMLAGLAAMAWIARRQPRR